MSADDPIPLVDPKTGERVGEVWPTPVAAVSAQVERARAAGRAWALRPLAERMAVVRTLGDRILSRAADLAAALVEELGKPAPEAWTSEIVVTAELFDHWLGAIEDELEPIPVNLNPVNYPFKEVQLVPEPVGVVGLIMPWNYPVNLPLRTIVPALLAGNAIVFKPSEHALRCGKLLGDIAAEVLPEGLFATILGGPAQGAAVVEAGVDRVVFTGSVAGGRAVAAAAAQRLIPCALELGSKDAAIVLPDARLERAAAGIVWGAFHNAGQDCASVERVYVHGSIHDAFVDAVVKKTEALRLDTDIGPLVSASALLRVSGQVAEAVAAGAVARTGGTPANRGFFYPPTVLTGVDAGLRVMREESFGPILPIVPFDTEDEAVERANDTPYGLTVSVWGKDVARARAVADRVRVGVAFVNNCCFTGPMGGAAWGGRGESGHGVTGSRYALDGLVQPRTVCVDRAMGAREMWWYPYSDALTTLSRGLVELGRRGGAKLGGAGMAVRGLLGRWN